MQKSKVNKVNKRNTWRKKLFVQIKLLLRLFVWFYTTLIKALSSIANSNRSELKRRQIDEHLSGRHVLISYVNIQLFKNFFFCTILHTT